MFNDCMLWSGHKDKWGYGKKGNGILAHRFFYEQLVGPISRNVDIDHICNTPPCFNVDHLQAVSHAENMRRMSSRITHCKRGHEFTEENTYMQPKGSRTCRKCQALAVLRYATKRKTI